VDTQGSATATAGDNFQGSYDYTLALTGTGNLSYTLKATAESGLLTLFTKSSTTPLQGPATKEYSDTFAYDGIPISGSIPFDLQLVVSWDDSTAGDQLSITVPMNSIDLAVVNPASVPEPSALPLLGLGVLGLLGWRRFAPRGKST